MEQQKHPAKGKNPVYITDVMLRDAHQSLLATRLRTIHMLPITDQLNRAGYWSLEMWGGATIDSMMRFLNEDPWERVRVLKAAMPDTRLQMLMRGQNIVGYRNYADDVVREFVRLAAKAGIDVFRCFDALNDIRNLETSMTAVREAGKWVEGTISYTMSPVHSIPGYVQYADELVKRGAQSVCIKDMAGLLEPHDAYELVSALKQAHPEVLVHMHSHYTSGMASMTYLKAVEAGADILDCAISSLSMALSMLRRAILWIIDGNSFRAAPPTRRVGESSVMRSGCFSSILMSSLMSRSYSPSEISGASRT
jgi:pyruvate/oxaloacetate carboxyltransferase